MKTTFLVSLITAAVVTAATFATACVAGPLDLVKNIGRTVEADPNKDYALTQAEGPYLIYVAAFSGPTARQDASTLVLELRKSFKWNAYVCEKTFAHDASKDFKSPQNPYFKTKYKYINSGAGTEFAVLIGNFLSLDDKQFEKTLAEVRKCKPTSLKNKTLETPFAMAFGVSNPMLPPENQRGFVDPFIESINKNRPYTLLRNPRRYTVQIATFKGGSTYVKESGPWLGGSQVSSAGLPPSAGQKMSELEKGEQATVTLCKALRERGVDAYEFHDRYASIVTVGSFDHYGQMMPDGTTKMDPLIQQIIQQYQGQVTGKSYNPVIINGIECDVMPKVIEVPRVRR